VLIAVLTVGMVWNLWTFAVLFFVGALSIVNRQLLKYMLLHSFDLYLQDFMALLMCICEGVLRWEELQSGAAAFQFANYSVMHLLIIVCVQTCDGYRIANWMKRAAIIIAIGAYCKIFWTALFLSGADFEGVEDVMIPIPWAWHHQTMSVRGQMVQSAFNIVILFISKAIFQMKYANCVVAATYPSITWMGEGIREKIRSSLERTRTVTMSLNIYKQSLMQKIELYLHEDNDMLHVLFAQPTADRIERYYFSIWNICAGSALFAAFVTSTVLSVWSAVIALEFCCLLFLLLGLCTFDLKMVRFHFASFDLYYKLFEWALYIMADTHWSILSKDMDAVLWLDFVLRDAMTTLVIFYIIFIDSYQISHRFKIALMMLILSWILYHALCILNRILTFNPSQTWSDHEVELPILPFLRIPISLQSTMLNAIGMFLLFMFKQLLLMWLHPNKAVFQVYPNTEWIGDKAKDDNEVEIVEGGSEIDENDDDEVEIVEEADGADADDEVDGDENDELNADEKDRDKRISEAPAEKNKEEAEQKYENTTDG